MIARLKNDAGVTALVPAARIYQQEVPANTPWPYIVLGARIETAFLASCLDGRTVRFAVHGYAVSGPVYGETVAEDIADAVAVALDGATFALTDTAQTKAMARWISNNTIRDSAESKNFHSICQIEISVLG